MGNGFVLHGAVDDDPREFLGFDQIELQRHVDGLRQQFFHAFFAQELAKLDEGAGVTGLAVFVVGIAREELPAWAVGPACHHALVGFVKRVLEVEQRDHGAQWYAGASGIACDSGALHLLSKEVQVWHDHACAIFVGEDL